MNEQVYTLLDELKKYRDTDKRHQDENYFTEILKWYLNNVDYFKKEFLEIIGLPQMIDARFESQVPLYDAYGFMDLFAETQNDVVIIENKINAPVSDYQLKTYVDDIQNKINCENKNQMVHLCLITKRTINKDILNTLKINNAPILMTWQELYSKLSSMISGTNQSTTLWKMLVSYFMSSGLLRRKPLTESNIKDKRFLKGQCISMMEDLALDVKINELFSNYRKMFNIIDFPSEQIIEYRWGRTGLNLSQSDPESSENWWPNIFIGVVLDNNDHKLKPFNGPKVVIIVEWNYKKYKSKERENILINWKESLYRFKIENQDDNTKIHLNYELENKWRFIVIEKDLLYFINKDSLKIQDSEFVGFYTKWLIMLSEKLLLQSMFIKY